MQHAPFFVSGFICKARMRLEGVKVSEAPLQMQQAGWYGKTHRLMTSRAHLHAQSTALYSNLARCSQGGTCWRIATGNLSDLSYRIV